MKKEFYIEWAIRKRNLFTRSNNFISSIIEFRYKNHIYNSFDEIIVTFQKEISLI